MLEGGKIPNKQAVCLLIATILATSTVFLPTLMFIEAKQDAWIAVLVATAFGLAAALIIASLGARFPDRTIIQYGGDIAGKPLGKVIGLAYILSFLFINSIIVREFSDMFNTAFMPETPARVFAIGIVLASSYAIRGGLEVLARTCEIVTPLGLITLALSFVLIYPEIDVIFFRPLLEEGVIPVFQSVLPATIFFGEVVIMVMVIPFLVKPSKAARSMVLAVLIVGLFQLLITATMIGVFAGASGNLEFPVLQLVRYISVADLIERVEPFVFLIWVTGAVVKVGILHYCAILSIAQWLDLREYRALVLPVGALLVTLSTVIWESIVQLTDFIISVLPPYAVAIEVGLPLALLALARLRGKGGTA